MEMESRRVWNEAAQMNQETIAFQLISNTLAYASEEMGVALRNAAYSPNIKERMDHSAAIFDAYGRLRAQAEHIPVHLGSLPWGMKNLIEVCERKGPHFEEGSMIMSNNPYICGTHLNDVTVVQPVYSSGTIVAFVANKAHHADVGGKVPGSISIDSKTLYEEGAVFEPVRLMQKRDIVSETIRRFSNSSRSPKERLGDLRAQVAANLTGERRILDVISKYGLDVFLRAADYAFAHSEAMMRSRISNLRSGVYHSTEVLEGPEGRDLELCAKVTVKNGSVAVDYEGTAEQVPYPLNSVFGVTLSGVFYVLRTLTGDDIPANHGAFSSIEVKAPEGTIVNPTSPHPVGGGNVETSQRNADLIYRSLLRAGPHLVPAASGGSMNNVMIGGGSGRSKWAFYETMGVGLGGQKGLDGIDGIQCNMTNTMNTPVEEIERSLPLLVTKYEFRPGSGGAGEFRGGCGLIRRFRALDSDIVFTVLADRERHSPWGLKGGKPGSRTIVLLRRNGAWSRLNGKSTTFLGGGDEVEVRTAGGGGYGNPAKRLRSLIKRDVANGLMGSAKTESDE
jgi:N-methylhydantoinase B